MKPRPQTDPVRPPAVCRAGKQMEVANLLIGLHAGIHYAWPNDMCQIDAQFDEVISHPGRLLQKQYFRCRAHIRDFHSGIQASNLSGQKLLKIRY